jgi:hypothetical protein
MFKKLSFVSALLVFAAVSFSGAAITHPAAVRDTLAKKLLGQIDSANYAKVVLLTSGDAPLDSVTLQNPAFTQSGATLTLIGGPISSTAVGDGTIAKFILKTANGRTIFAGSVTATGGGGDLTVDNTSVVVGQTVNLTSLTYTIMP